MKVNSSHILTIDQGNTAAKVKVIHNLHTVCAHVSPEPDVELVAGLIERFGIEAGVYCSIGKIDIRLAETLRCLLSGRLLVITHETPVPVKIDYASPSSLGPDRLAALCGAAALWPGKAMVVADAGTCLTLDLLTADGSFPGGDIAPGVEMRLRSMHCFTRSLPEVAVKGALPPFGTDTSSAMRCGAVNGAAAQIIASFRMAKKRIGAEAVALTGGDAGLLLPLLRQHISSIYLNPDLNSVGLISILKHNEYI